MTETAFMLIGRFQANYYWPGSYQAKFISYQITTNYITLLRSRNTNTNAKRER